MIGKRIEIQSLAEFTSSKRSLDDSIGNVKDLEGTFPRFPDENSHEDFEDKDVFEWIETVKILDEIDELEKEFERKRKAESRRKKRRNKDTFGFKYSKSNPDPWKIEKERKGLDNNEKVIEEDVPKPILPGETPHLMILRFAPLYLG